LTVVEKAGGEQMIRVPMNVFGAVVGTSKIYQSLELAVMEDGPMRETHAGPPPGTVAGQHRPE